MSLFTIITWIFVFGLVGMLVIGWLIAFVELGKKLFTKSLNKNNFAKH